jgi:hypothetical protein
MQWVVQVLGDLGPVLFDSFLNSTQVLVFLMMILSWACFSLSEHSLFYSSYNLISLMDLKYNLVSLVAWKTLSIIFVLLGEFLFFL